MRGSRERTLSHDEARAFYDRLGARQDSQAFYEDAATDILLRHGFFERARSLLEFGCGTGRFAEALLERAASDTRYLGLDLSATMTELASRRLARFGDRARVVQTEGSPKLDVPTASVDRFVSNFVFDLLAEEEIAELLEEVHRVLLPGGYVALASLTHPFTPGSQMLMAGWRAVHALRPAWVGGCRPVGLIGRFGPRRWQVLHHERIARYGLPMEALVAERLP